MFIGKRRLKQIKLVLVSSELERLSVLLYLILMPIVTLYEDINQTSIDLRRVKAYYNFDAFEQLNSTDDILQYLEINYLPKYFCQGLSCNHYPIQQLLFTQQREPRFQCNGSFIDCEYGFQDRTEIIFSPTDANYCISTNCSEFDKTELIIPIQSIVGHYRFYEELDYQFIVNINTNTTDLFYNLSQTDWVDNKTNAVVIFGSVYDLISDSQIQINLIIERLQDQNFYFQEIIYTLPIIDTSDDVHLILFSIFTFICVIKVFRSILELTYIFSRFNLMFQLYSIISILMFVISRMQIIILRYNTLDELLVFDRVLLSQYVSGKMINISTSLQLQNIQTTEDMAKMFLWIAYPFTLLQFLMLFVQFQWIQKFLTIFMRTMPSQIFCGLLVIVFDICVLFPQTILGLEQLVNSQSAKYTIYIFASVFLDQPQYKTTYMYFIFCLQYIVKIVIYIYVISISNEAHKKASLIEMPYETRAEKDMTERISDLTLKLDKVVKLVKKIYIKEDANKKKKDEEYFDEENSEYNFQQMDDKILIVFEINNHFLEDIARYKAKKENNIQVQRKVRIQNKPKIGSIISQLLQKNRTTNPRLQVMLSQYQNQNQSDYIQLNDEQDQEEFLIQYTDSIEKEGITIRQFVIVDQVVKFLSMLLKLRPEFLSLNAEQRIRILFYINSDQVLEEDVYKLLSYLIVNLAKQHLTYPILVYSQFKDWYIEKEQYLKLKKFYKNIFSTLDKECAYHFSIMKTTFPELQAIFSGQKQFYEKDLEEISNSIIEDNEEKSDLQS